MSGMRRAASRPAKDRIPIRAAPMLATLVEAPFHKGGWIYEEKYDGDRMLAYKESDRVRLLSRNGKERTDGFPRIAAALRALSARTLLLDGEIVVFDGNGVSRFQLLQRNQGEPVYAAFDCLFYNGKDLRPEPLSSRRTAKFRRSSAWRLREWPPALRRQGWNRIRWQDSRRALSPLPATSEIGFGAARTSSREGCGLYRTQARRPDLIPGMDRRQEAPPAGVSRPAR